MTLTSAVVDKTRRIARRNRVLLHQGALMAQVDDAIGGEDLHRLIQAAVEVTSLIQGKRSTSRVNFDTEVESFIIQSGVVYDVDYRVKGQRESHDFKFHIDSGRNLLVQPVSSASESAAHAWAERWAYRFSDALANKSEMQPIAVLDDRGNRRAVDSQGAGPNSGYCDPVGEQAPVRGHARHIGPGPRQAMDISPNPFLDQVS